MLIISNITNCIKFHPSMVRTLHSKCLGGFYPRSGKRVERPLVPADKISWDVKFDDYRPIEFTATHILSGASYADLDVNEDSFKPQWNALDGKANRVSHNGTYQVIEGRPQNPVGRSGIVGRGCLGRWGPNHAADSVVTRWRKDFCMKQVLNNSSMLPILQFVAIERKDCGKWAIPGGMVDPGERVSQTVRREFMEEALNSNEMSREAKEAADRTIRFLFDKGEKIYSGYVDDPRNTDNAWMETVAYHFHDEGDLFDKVALAAGDDAAKVKWMDICATVSLYASHSDIIQKAVERLGAHW